MGRKCKVIEFEESDGRPPKRLAYPEERLGFRGPLHAHGVVSIKTHACNAHAVTGTLLGAVLERRALRISTHSATTSLLGSPPGTPLGRSTPDRLAHRASNIASHGQAYTHTRTHARTHRLRHAEEQRAPPAARRRVLDDAAQAPQDDAPVLPRVHVRPRALRRQVGDELRDARRGALVRRQRRLARRVRHQRDAVVRRADEAAVAGAAADAGADVVRRRGEFPEEGRAAAGARGGLVLLLLLLRDRRRRLFARPVVEAEGVAPDLEDLAAERGRAALVAREVTAAGCARPPVSVFGADWALHPSVSRLMGYGRTEAEEQRGRGG